MNRILGVDPGSRITGYGIIDFDGERSVHVASGCIKTADGELPQRPRYDFHRPGRSHRYLPAAGNGGGEGFPQSQRPIRP